MRSCAWSSAAAQGRVGSGEPTTPIGVIPAGAKALHAYRGRAHLRPLPSRGATSMGPGRPIASKTKGAHASGAACSAGTASMTSGVVHGDRGAAQRRLRVLIEQLRRPGRTGRVPERLQQVHVRRGGQVEAHAARLEAEQQHRRAARLAARKLAQHLARTGAAAGGTNGGTLSAIAKRHRRRRCTCSASGRRERPALHGVSGRRVSGAPGRGAWRAWSRRCAARAGRRPPAPPAPE
jgi:hypothetical protein